MNAFHDLEANELDPMWGLLWVLRFKNGREERGQ